MKTVGKTVVIRDGKATVEDWPETHLFEDGSTVKFAKAPGSVIVGDVFESLSFDMGRRIKIRKA